MKRSSDVTASAIILFFGSGLLMLLAIFVPLANLSSRPDTVSKAILPVLAAIYGAPAIWGVVNGVGILRLRPWARTSMIVMSVVATAFLAFIAVAAAIAPILTRSDPEFSNVPMGLISAIMALFASIPLAIAIWWLVLFTRKRVIAEFASDGGVPFPVEAVSLDTSIPSSGERQFASAQTAASAAPHIPLSIRVIAILYLIGGAFALLGLSYSIQLNMPTLLLGKLLEGWPAWIFLSLFGLIQIVICVAVFKKCAWALDGLIAVLIFGAANTVSFAIAPSRTALWDRIVQAESLPRSISAASMESMINTIMPIPLSLGVVLALVCLYFLLTRRAAFRAACAAGSPVSISE